MRVILFALSALSFLAGGSILISAQSAIHEIEAFVLFLIAATLLSGAAVVEALSRKRKSDELLEKIETKLGEQTAILDRAYPIVSKEKALPPVVGQEKYHLSIDGNVSGPYTIDAVHSLYDRGSIDDSTMILKEGTSGWQPLKSFGKS